MTKCSAQFSGGSKMYRNLAGLFAVLSLGACATPYVATPYDRADANVRSIAIMDDAAGDEAIAYEIASVGSNFGLIGALVDAGIQAERRQAVNRALESADFDGEDALERRLIQRLGGEGYRVAVRDGSTRAKRAFMVSYPSAEGATDAYLDVIVEHYGYLSAGAFQPFRPSASVKVRLVSAADPTKILMDNWIVYNVVAGSATGAITLAPNPQYEFQNREQLLADPERMAAGIEDALNQVAETAVQLLR